LFRSDTPTRLAAIAGAIAARDAAELQAAAHGVKGSCAMIGAVAMSRMCEQLEALAGTAAFDDAAVMHKALTDCFDRTLLELEALGAEHE
jgi:HPt (histidine-containing phosphotransfer) domain-containing protein